MLNPALIPCLAIFVSAYLLGAVLCLLGVIMAKKGFSTKQKEGYSLLRNFPFEAFESKSQPSHTGHFLFVFGLVLSFLSSLLPLALTAFPDFSFLLPLAILLAILSLAEHGLFVVLTYIPAYDFKRHLTVFTFFAGASVLFLVLSGLAFQNLGKAYVEFQGLGFGIMGFFLLLALGEMLCLLTPKMASWTKMESTMNEDGSTYTTRPKIFLLAFFQWGIFLLGELAIGVGIIGYLVFANAMIA